MLSVEGSSAKSCLYKDEVWFNFHIAHSVLNFPPESIALEIVFNIHYQIYCTWDGVLTQMQQLHLFSDTCFISLSSTPWCKNLIVHSFSEVH